VPSELPSTANLVMIADCSCLHILVIIICSSI